MMLPPGASDLRQLDGAASGQRLTVVYLQLRNIFTDPHLFAFRLLAVLSTPGEIRVFCV